LILHPTLAVEGQEEEEEAEALTKEEKRRRHRERVKEADEARDSKRGWTPSASALSLGAAKLRTTDAADREYVGLANQGATCYMNSLLQTLFMTPEFRTTMYAYEYDEEKDGPRDECMPYHLQRLFATLQLSSDAFVSTQALTKSFGWTEDDAFQQQDVQELLRVLLDALEDAFSDTRQHSIVKDLYEGTMIDYCKCDNCGNETQRTDTFLDLSLSLKPFGSTACYDGLETSIQEYLKAEHLDGENKVFCERCAAKHAAQKGFRISKLPLLLTVQLMRFDYDLETLRRVKLNNRFTFPETLDMNPFVWGPEEDSPREGSGAPEGEDDFDMDIAPASEKDDGDGLPDLVDVHGNKSKDQVDEEIASAQRAGEWVYELYSVLVHSGGTYGGHYYAYIKNLDDKSWHVFDDSSVRRAREGFSKVKSAWGGMGTSTSAYMLMYRKVAPTTMHFPRKEAIPSPLKSMMEQIEEDRRRADELEREEKQRLKLPVFAATNTPTGFLTNISPRPQDTLGDTKLLALAYLAGSTAVREGDTIDAINTRLRRYSRELSVPREVFEGKHNGKSIAELGIKSGDPLFIEVKSPNAPWMPYEPDAYTLKVFLYNPNSDDFDGPRNVQIGHRSTLRDLKLRIKTAFNVLADPGAMEVQKFAASSSTTATRTVFAGSDDETMTDLRAYDGLAVYVEILDASDTEESSLMEEAEGSETPARALAAYIREMNQLTITYNMPAWINSAPNADSAPGAKGRHAIRQIKADRRWSLERLREALQQDLQLPHKRFRIRKLHDKGIELRPPGAILDQKIQGSTSHVHLEEGDPLEVGQFSFKVFYFPFPRRLVVPVGNGAKIDEAQDTPAWSEASSEACAEDEPIYDLNHRAAYFEYLETYVVSNDTTVAELRQRIWKDLRKHVAAAASTHDFGSSEGKLICPEPTHPRPNISSISDALSDGTDETKTSSGQEQSSFGCAPLDLDERLPCTVEHLRIRQKSSSRCTTIFRVGDEDSPFTLKDNLASMYDGAELAVQVLPEPEHLSLGPTSERHMVLNVHWFDRQTWRIHDAVEVTITKKYSASDCAIAIVSALEHAKVRGAALPTVAAAEDPSSVALNGDLESKEEDQHMLVQEASPFFAPGETIVEIVSPSLPSVSVFRPSTHKIFKKNLPDEHWQNLSGSQPLEDLRWYVADGDTVIAQDPCQQLGPMPSYLLKQPALTTTSSTGSLSGVSGTSFARPERGLKIRHRGKRSPGPNGNASRGSSPMTTPSVSPGRSPPPSRTVTPTPPNGSLSDVV